MATTQSEIPILILAAGESSRMGRPKQILPWGQTTLLGRVIEVASNSSDKVIVVLGARAEAIKAQLGKTAHCIVNPDWQEGMGSSIAAGMQSLRDGKASGVLILLGDQPMIDRNFIKRLIDSFEGNPSRIVATAYGQRAGVPALFGRDYFSDLSGLDREEGAKGIIMANRNRTVLVSGGDVTIDIDTKEDYHKAISISANNEA